MEKAFPASGARTVHGTIIGIIVLDTGFERLPGDIAHADTWPFPVQFRVVRGVRPADVINGDPTRALPAFFAAIDELADLGVSAITTSCGFLSAVQNELSAYAPVPFLSSALLQIPLIERTLPAQKRVGVLVSDLDALKDIHLLAIGVAPNLPMAGLPADSVLRTNMRTNTVGVDRQAQEREVVAAAGELLKAYPDIGAIVCECANFPPYSAAIARRFGLPVYDIVTLIQWLHMALAPPRYSS
ncbi:aspartate/glutamate racemase family protein [Sodalis sp. RH21]|uniref:aspartate/glutamate racemase family protein n=1 Tax=unclassified Sodalis (in: enterobacteria) TaxID=2636512 RepID=UPI0039B562DF